MNDSCHGVGYDAVNHVCARPFLRERRVPAVFGTGDGVLQAISCDATRPDGKREAAGMIVLQ